MRARRLARAEYPLPSLELAHLGGREEVLFDAQVPQRHAPFPSGAAPALGETGVHHVALQPVPLQDAPGEQDFLLGKAFQEAQALAREAKILTPENVGAVLAASQAEAAALEKKMQKG